jgi:hypothetical protein
MPNYASANGDGTAPVAAGVSGLIQQHTIQPLKLNGLVNVVKGHDEEVETSSWVFYFTVP